MCFQINVNLALLVDKWRKANKCLGYYTENHANQHFYCMMSLEMSRQFEALFVSNKLSEKETQCAKFLLGFYDVARQH